MKKTFVEISASKLGAKVEWLLKEIWINGKYQDIVLKGTISSFMMVENEGGYGYEVKFNNAPERFKTVKFIDKDLQPTYIGECISELEFENQYKICTEVRTSEGELDQSEAAKKAMKLTANVTKTKDELKDFMIQWQKHKAKDFPAGKVTVFSFEKERLYSMVVNSEYTAIHTFNVFNVSLDQYKENLINS